MKRFSWVILVLVCILALTGCGKEAAPPVPEPVDETPAEPVERVPKILDADVPERNPFTVAGGPAWQNEGATVKPEGRNPFVASADASGWETESSAVNTNGRDPFTQVPNETTEPEPVDPGPVEPEDPVDPEVPVPGTVIVELRTTDRCWLDIFVDDVRVLRTNVPSDESLRWEAEREIRLEQVGREPAVLATVNGKDLGSLAQLVQRLGQSGTLVDQEAGVEISLERRYPGGVLVGLRFTVLNRE